MAVQCLYVGDIVQAIIRRPAPEQISAVTLREWQRYRGWTVKILEDLEHSGGKTVQDISTGIWYRRSSTSRTLRHMRVHGLVERVERWGWRITRDGLFLLSLSQEDRNRIIIGENPASTRIEEKSEPAPPCFALPSCHIRRLCEDKRYTKKNQSLCHGIACCIWGAAGRDRVPVETKVGGHT